MNFHFLLHPHLCTFHPYCVCNWSNWSINYHRENTPQPVVHPRQGPRAIAPSAICAAPRSFPAGTSALRSAAKRALRRISPAQRARPRSTRWGGRVQCATAGLIPGLLLRQFDLTGSCAAGSYSPFRGVPQKGQYCLRGRMDSGIVTHVLCAEASC